MKKIYGLLVGVLTVGLVGAGLVATKATGSAATPTDWAVANGRADYSKLPDSAQVPYACWNGKMVTLSGKTVKEKATTHSMPGSKAYQLGLAKSKELAGIPGVVTKDARDGEVMTIDDTNPQVAAVMQKYEAQETPECQ